MTIKRRFGLVALLLSLFVAPGCRTMARVGAYVGVVALGAAIHDDDCSCHRHRREARRCR